MPIFIIFWIQKQSEKFWHSHWSLWEVTLFSAILKRECWEEMRSSDWYNRLPVLGSQVETTRLPVGYTDRQVQKSRCNSVLLVYCNDMVISLITFKITMQNIRVHKCIRFQYTLNTYLSLNYFTWFVSNIIRLYAYQVTCTECATVTSHMPYCHKLHTPSALLSSVTCTEYTTVTSYTHWVYHCQQPL